MANSALITALGVLTTISNIGLALSPVPDMHRVHRDRSTGVMVVSPLVAMWISNNLWLVYAYATSSIFPLLVVSVVGEVLSILYIIVYARWSSERMYVAKTVAAGVTVFVPVTMFLILAETDAIHLSDGQTSSVFGYLADAMNFFLYLSPLEKLRQVIATKSAASIPVLMSVTICANCALWLVTGIVDYDLFILVPNAIGTVLSATQVVLYVTYRPGRYPQPGIDEPAKTELPTDLEMQPMAASGSPRSPAFRPLVSPLAPLQH